MKHDILSFFPLYKKKVLPGKEKPKLMFLVFSWFVCFPGIGAGVSSSIFGFLTRSTAPEDRATVFAAFMACRQAGLVIGQCLFAFLRQILKIV